MATEARVNANDNYFWKLVQSKLRERLDKIFYYYAFMMAFPQMLLFFNLNFWIFPVLMQAFGRIERIRINKFIQLLAILFGVGAILSTLYSVDMKNSFVVLPNFIYWSLLIVLFVSYREHISINLLYKASFWGVVFSVAYYFVLADLGITALPIFKTMPQNSFAFILICYTPLAVYYARQRYNPRFAFVFVLFLTALGFLGGSRAGSILTGAGAFLAYYSKQLTVRTVTIGVTAAVLGGGILLSIPIMQDVVFALNEETYDLIYNTEEVLQTDRSYLIRKAMQEKGLMLYQRSPLTGIGLNNFGHVPVDLKGDFEGSQYVIHKHQINELSAHNSYINILGEGGLFMLVPFILILASCILFFLFSLNRMPPAYKPVFIALICMSFHLYAISAIVNVYAWFLIALACSFVYRKNKDNEILKER